MGLFIGILLLLLALLVAGLMKVSGRCAREEEERWKNWQQKH